MNICSNQITTFRHRITAAATDSTSKELKKKIHPPSWSGDEERLSWVTQLPLAPAGLCAKPQGSLEEAGPGKRDAQGSIVRVVMMRGCSSSAPISLQIYLNSTKAGAHDRNDLPHVYLTLSASSTETSSAFTFRKRRIRPFPAGKRGLRLNLWRCTRHHLAHTSTGKPYNPGWLWYPPQHFKEKLLQGSRRIPLIHPTSKSTVGQQQVTRHQRELFTDL